MISNNLAETILLSPLDTGADTINIVASSATPTMASWYLTTLHEKREQEKKQHKHTIPCVHINLVIGMTSMDGIPSSWHNEFKELHHCKQLATIDDFSCSYVYEMPAVRSNLYVWTKEGNPTTAFMGSAPFCQDAFLPSTVEDIMEPVDPKESLVFYDTICNRSMFCTHAEIEENVRVKNDDLTLTELSSQTALEHVTLSLLTKDGTIGRKSGLNWGQRAHRNPNQAYIPVPIEIARKRFFPNEKQQFTVQTDDHKSLILRLEQEKDKALTTPLSNSLLGEYFRRRLGVGNGDFVTEEDLYRYGRTDVTFTKIDEEQFYMDFSRPC
ncbi:restriction endonuclease PLD domain-containing protein [Bifidobacterium callitrichos]|nr:restriction endonuclease PLD domain-containing protein [Bifidobacterium callitrichos]